MLTYNSVLDGCVAGLQGSWTKRFGHHLCVFWYIESTIYRIYPISRDPFPARVTVPRCSRFFRPGVVQWVMKFSEYLGPPELLHSVQAYGSLLRILHFLAFLAFWVREHFNVYTLAQKRILFPHRAWQPNNTKGKKHMFLVFPHVSQRTFKSQQILIHIFHFETLRKSLALWHHHHRSHLRKLTPMKPENKAQRHGKRTKNIYQTIILPILLNSGDFLGVLKNLHLFTFHQTKGSLMAGPCSSMDSRPQCLTVAMRRIAKTWCDHPGGHRDEWPGPQLYEQVTEMYGKFQSKGIKKMNKGCILTNIALSKCENSHFFVSPPFEIGWFGSHFRIYSPSTNPANAPEQWKKMMALEDDSFLFEMVPISGYRLW